MKNNDDNVELFGEYLRDRKPFPQEEQYVLDQVLTELPSEVASVPEEVLRDFRSAGRPSAVNRVRPGVLAGAAAAAILATVLWVVLTRSGSPAVFESGARVAFNEVVRSASGTSVVLTLKDRSQIEMRPNSELVVEKADDGIRIRLVGGSVLVTAAAQRTGHLYVETKDITVSVTGTVFLVNAEEAGSRVAVIQGEVRVQEGTVSKKLLSGEQTVTNPLMESHPVIEEISWNRGTEAHMALVQQSAPPQTVPKLLEFEAASIRPGESILSRLPTRLRCRGIDGELTPFGANAPPTPLGRCVGDNVPLVQLVVTAYDTANQR